MNLTRRNALKAAAAAVVGWFMGSEVEPAVAGCDCGEAMPTSVTVTISAGGAGSGECIFVDMDNLTCRWVFQDGQLCLKGPLPDEEWAALGLEKPFTRIKKRAAV